MPRAQTPTATRARHPGHRHPRCPPKSERERQRGLVKQLGCQGGVQHPLVIAFGGGAQHHQCQRRLHGRSVGSSSTGATDPSSEQYISYGGGYTVRNTPAVIPPSVVGGNACAVGASGGMSVAGFGIAAGSTWADRACERRQQAALLFNMGESKVALELMCQDDHVRDAMKLSGKPCSADIPVAQAPAVVAVPVAQAAPAQAAIAGAVPAVPEPTLIAAVFAAAMAVFLWRNSRRKARL